MASNATTQCWLGETIHLRGSKRLEAAIATRSRPTITDIAKQAGVSPTTVSYVLSGPKARADRISEATSDRIRDAAAAVGYVPNQSARTLRLRRTNRVLFLANRFTSLFSQAIAESIQLELRKQGLSMSLQVGSGLDSIRTSINALAQHAADGLIVEANDDHIDELRKAAASGLSLVAIGPSSAETELDIISNDIGTAVSEAMIHVVAQGYLHFVLLTSNRDFRRDHRISVAESTLQAAGVTSENISVIYCPHDRIGAYHAALDFLQEGEFPVVVYAGSDVSAIGVLWAAIHKGLNVPEQVAIIGHGNSPETEITVPPLTSIGLRSLDFSQAADLVATRIRNPSIGGRHISQPCELSIRESTSAHANNGASQQERRSPVSRA